MKHVIYILVLAAALVLPAVAGKSAPVGVIPADTMEVDPLDIEYSSFVTWMVNDQRFRRDTVGALALAFANDQYVRSNHLASNYGELLAYLTNMDADLIHVEALQIAWDEWQQLFGWYGI
jgi:hypothetical protein